MMRQMPAGQILLTDDASALAAAFNAGTLIRPTAGHLNLVDLSLAIAAANGAGTPRDAGPRRLADAIGPNDHLIVVMADGMGMNVLGTLPRQGFLRRHLRMSIHTVFPSASAVALTTLATGEWPSRHAVTGWWTYVPELGLAGALLPFVMRDSRRSLAELGADLGLLIHGRPLLDSSERDVLALHPKQFCDSPYSKFFSGQRRRAPYASLEHATRLLIARLRDATGPTYTYLYNHRIDALAHRYGAASPEVREAAADLDRALGELYNATAGKARIVVTADHGLLDAAEGSKHLIPPTDRLLDDLSAPPTGDSRVQYLHVKGGAEASVRERFGDLVERRFYVITFDEAHELRLFGPGAYPGAARARIGDLIAISKGEDVVEYPGADGSGNMLAQIAHHSGLHPDEMLIPLIVA